MSSLGGCVLGVTRVRAASGATRLRLPRPRRGRHLPLSWCAVRRAWPSCPPPASPVAVVRRWGRFGLPAFGCLHEG